MSLVLFLQGSICLVGQTRAHTGKFVQNPRTFQELQIDSYGFEGLQVYEKYLFTC